MTEKPKLKNGWYRDDEFPAVEHFYLMDDLVAWLQPRPHYCDRGHWQLNVDVPHLDSADGFPRYYMDYDTAKKEAEAFIGWRLYKIDDKDFTVDPLEYESVQHPVVQTYKGRPHELGKAKPIWERIDDIMQDVPPGSWETKRDKILIQLKHSVHPVITSTIDSTGKTSILYSIQMADDMLLDLIQILEGKC